MDSHQARRPLTPQAALRCRLGLGTHALHRLVSADARQHLLQLAYDLGIRHFDTAPSYGAGLAEREIGRFAAGQRSTLVLTTKFGIAPGRLAAALPGGVYLTAAARAALRMLWLRRSVSGAARRDYSVPAMQTSLEDSLRRLRTDYVDVLYLHAPTRDSLESPETLLRALEALRQAGKVRRIGLSGSAAECGAIARSHPGLAEILQIELAPDSQGLPDGTSLPAATAVGLWEFPGTPPGSPTPSLLPHFERLRQVVPTGMVLLSTPERAAVRQAADFFAHEQAPGARS